MEMHERLSKMLEENQLLLAELKDLRDKVKEMNNYFGPCMCGGCRRCLHDQGLHCGDVDCCGPICDCTHENHSHDYCTGNNCTMEDDNETTITSQEQESQSEITQVESETGDGRVRD